MVCLCHLGLVLLDGHGLLGVDWGGVVFLAGVVFLLGLVVDGWGGHGGVLLLLGILMDLVVVVVVGPVREVVLAGVCKMRYIDEGSMGDVALRR